MRWTLSIDVVEMLPLHAVDISQGAWLAASQKDWTLQLNDRLNMAHPAVTM